MDQKPRPSSSNMPQRPPIVASPMTSTTVSPSTSSFVLTSGNLRPITNYTLVASSQVPVTHQYIVQSTTSAAMPQYVNTGSVRHILSSSSQPSNITYMLPSGAQIVRMNNVITTTIAGDPRLSTQYILTPSPQRSNSSAVPPSGSQSPKISAATVAENNSGSSEVVSKALGAGPSTSPIFQRPGVTLPRMNATYYGQIRGNDTPRISFRPRLNEQKPGTSFILTSNDWSGTKNVPISSLQKINTNYVQIPLIQKPGSVLSTNASRPKFDTRVGQQPRPQNQTIRSVFLPSSFRAATVSPQRGTDGQLILNSINLPTQVINSTDNRPRSASVPVSNIQRFSTNYMQIPIAQNPGTVINRGNTPGIDNNVRIGQQHQTIRSVILPSNYRAALASPRRGVDYRLILKPILRNLASPQNTIPQHNFPRNPSTPQPSHSSSRPGASRIPNEPEIIASSHITPISLKERENQLLITEKSIQICIDELKINSLKKGEPNIDFTEPAIKLIQVEVTYRLFYLLRECKKFLIKSRTNILTEETTRKVCSSYFGKFYGNKLWPLFCLKPLEDGEDEQNRIWMRKHNNVNLVGWIKHPKFRNPSYMKKRRRVKLRNKNLILNELSKISEVVYEYLEPAQTQGSSEKSQESRIFFQSNKSNQVTSSAVLKNLSDLTSTSQEVTDSLRTTQIPGTSEHVSLQLSQTLDSVVNEEGEPENHSTNLYNKVPFAVLD